MATLLVRNGTVVTAERHFAADIYVRDEKIVEIGADLGRKYAAGADAPDRVIDATGCYVIPGGIDAHTHMELPLKTTTSSDSFETGTRAALFGGTTTIIDFANQVKGGSLLSVLEEWRKKADGHVCCDYALHVSVTDVNPATLAEVWECIVRGVTSFKAFTAYKGALMIDDGEMSALMREVGRLGGLLLVHAEDGDAIDAAIAKARAAGELAPKFHALTRPAKGEALAIGRVIDIAAAAGCPLYIVHLSSEAGLRRARAAVKKDPARVLLETCPQYLVLDDSKYEAGGLEGAKYVLSPPLRKPADQAALWEGLAAGLVSVVATDHCPFNLSQKAAGKDDFSRIPNGVPGVEHRLELLYSEGVAQGRLTLEQWVALTSTNPARIFGLASRKGIIAPGADADLVIFDPKASRTIGAKTHHMRCDNSVYEGQVVRGRCRTVVLRGRVVVDDKGAEPAPGLGTFLPRSVLQPDARGEDLSL